MVCSPRELILAKNPCSTHQTHRCLGNGLAPELVGLEVSTGQQRHLQTLPSRSRALAGRNHERDGTRDVLGSP